MKRSHVKIKKQKPRYYIFVFIFPAALIYTAFMIIPLIGSLGLSFFSNEGGGTSFVWFQNFQTLLTEEFWAPRFWGALKNNFQFFIIHVLVQNPVGLLLALLLTSKAYKGVPFFRTVFFMPTILSIVIVGFVWQLILSPAWGISRGFLELLHLGHLFKPWLGLEEFALQTLSLISVWQFVGIPMILFIAALITIPNDLMEAAYVDGASEWKIFTRIKLPLIMPVVGIVTVLTFIGNFNAFDLIYTVQGIPSGPNYSTDILGTLFFRTYYGYQLQLPNFAMGTTIAAMMFVIILAGVLTYMLVWRRFQETYEY